MKVECDGARGVFARLHQQVPICPQFFGASSVIASIGFAPIARAAGPAVVLAGDPKMGSATREPTAYDSEKALEGGWLARDGP